MRTAAAWQSIITQKSPLHAEPHLERHIYTPLFCSKCSRPPSGEPLSQQSAVHLKIFPDCWQAAENMLYLYCPQPICHQNAFSPGFFGKHLKVATSTRNWNIVLVLKRCLK
ncbi:MAG: hypothetical protein IPL35_14965 [Sphingobacteriales bacterium]|nr:hypothetical protein [Sphingobacteriales bacterium]